ncbi:MAG: Heat shock protein GrpE [Nitrosopumilales archaeon]|nr:MAG: Heat shock protein GrpE [Nitrosopumilales archaeon]
MSKEESEIPIEVKEEEPSELSEESFSDINQEESESKIESKEIPDDLQELLEKQKETLATCEEELKHSLADYQNLERKIKSDIEKGVKTKIDQFMLKFISIYDDFIRAKTILAEQKVNVSGLESILKNMDSLLSEYNVKPINALGEIFDPNLHEAVSVIEDSTLDDGTITKEIRKGYISQNRLIRPTIVEISKKSNLEKSEGK